MADIFYNRDVHCADAIEWLRDKEECFKAIITSLPDMEEVGGDYWEWHDFIVRACALLKASLTPDGVIFFYQTDRKYKGKVIDKKLLIHERFKLTGFDLILNKIVLKQEPNTVNFFRPTYTNLFAFSQKVRAGKPTPDVIHAGTMLYKNAMGFNACQLAIDFIKEKVKTDTIVDPFCGQGSVLKMANDNGFNAIGVDIDPLQVNKAQLL